MVQTFLDLVVEFHLANHTSERLRQDSRTWNWFEHVKRYYTTVATDQMSLLLCVEFAKRLKREFYRVVLVGVRV